MPGKPRKASPTPPDVSLGIEEAAGAGLAFGRAVLAAEVEIIASVLGLGAALAPLPGVKAPARALAPGSDVEEGFDNMPV